MNFVITTDTAGSKVGELADELRSYLEPRINEKYTSVDVNIAVAFRCLPETHRYKSFTRYTKKDNYLVIDIYLCLEDYLKMYKDEQRFYLGNAFIEYLKKAFEKRSFEGLDSNEFIENIIKLGREIKPGDWFSNEINWGSYLDL
jgi:hypothetical protein